MNFWHMQMHQEDENKDWTREKEVLENLGYIGMGVWQEKNPSNPQQKDFKETMNIGDIVAIKRGKKLIALTQVTGDYEYTEEVTDLDWFKRRRKVKVLDWYKDEYNYEVAWFGTLNICDSNSAKTTINIKKWYERVMNNKQIDEVIKLLEYKHQVILQGPPGTGKTRLAKLVADKLTEPENKGTPEQIIDNLIQTFDVNSKEARLEREKQQQLLLDFYKAFPKESLKELTLESYSIGTGDNNSFCWWIERGLKSLGYYFPGSSLSYKVYWSKSKEKYVKSGFVKDIEDDELAMKMVAETLHELVNDGNVNQALKRFGDSFILKVLVSYYPDEYFPINSKDAIANALKLFNSYDENESLLDQNKKLTQIYLDKTKELNSKMTKSEFAGIIWNNFDLKSGKDLTRSNEVQAYGKYEIIQFHPAYTYEDFVRGIVASSEEGNISYNVENKILANFAKEASDNPNGKYILIIDEINRANLPSVLGELIYALEYRGEPIKSMYEYEGSNDLKLPKNLYIIGTMNTADRSVGHIDYAIRRRFAFYDVLPNEDIIKNEKARVLFDKVSELFESRNLFLSSDFEADDVMIGHSYFIPSNEGMEDAEFEIELRQKLEYEIKPILYEYIKDGILLDTARGVVDQLDV